MTIRRRFAWAPLLAALVVIAALATAGNAARSPSPTLSIVFPVVIPPGSSLVNGTPYVVSGCGYNAANGGVTVVVRSPQATAFAGQLPDSNGCISLSNFSTQGIGSYQVDAYQTIHKNKSSIVASTGFTLS